MTAVFEPGTSFEAYDLADRYRVGAGPVLLTGIQAIARMLVEQRALDQRRGLRTGTFISGYPGSPLGGLDQLLLGLPKEMADADITVVPGLNEELAATAVWGSQSAVTLDTERYDGVTGVWYGKGPGVDRALDAMRHANMYGAHPTGGMLMLVGDDPAAKSSTVPAVSERTLASLGIPVLFPRNASEIVEYGMEGIALSRASGCVVALKIVADVADGAWVVNPEIGVLDPVTPKTQWEGVPYTYEPTKIELFPDRIVGAEAKLYGPRMGVVKAYAAENRLNRIEVKAPNAKVGIVASGSCYDSMRQGLKDLGLGHDDLMAAGIRVLRLGMMWPVEPTIVSEFAEGLEEIVVVEDKTSFIEQGIREILYGAPSAPVIIGKKDRNGVPLVPLDGELTAGRLLAPLRRALKGHAQLKAAGPTRIDLPLLSTSRTPYFCSGCPHNRSTALPDGSLGGGGIGCHTLVTASQREDSAVVGITQMGGEGSQWIGQAPYSHAGHTFQNVGDGTFFHSAQLAIQACVAAGVNITYKLLHNDVVAMTGAQKRQGAVEMAQLTHKLMNEGVKAIIVVADEPQRYRRNKFPAGVRLWHRDRLDDAQRELREVEGVTVLIYDQHCAADARRQRKRGTIEARNTKIVINEAVCEGCGDCGVKSNCLSVQPVETELGRKTRIDQTSCNTDYTCVEGECPSFMAVETDPTVKKAKKSTPEPPTVADPGYGELERTYGVFMAGIGGTGIVTVNQVLATAALRAGFGVESLDQVGMSQKAGPVTAHLRFGPGSIDPSNRVTPGSADALLGFDLLTLAEGKNLAYGDPARTRAVVSTSKTPTGPMVYDKDIAYPADDELLTRVNSATSSLRAFDALAAAETLFGNTAAANFLLVGAAYQTGALPIPAEAIEEAIGINGVAVSANVAAFRWGRASVAAPEEFAKVTGTATASVEEIAVPALDAATFDGEVRRLAEVRAPKLVAFQNQAIARDYVETVDRIWNAERSVTADTRFSEAVARYLFKLTAYKDEYEVARLLTAPAALDGVRAEVQGKISFKLSPPVFGAFLKGRKMTFGPRTHFMLRLLATMKFLRGTFLDPFGQAHVRRAERALLAHYTALVTGLAADLTEESYAKAVRLAELPDMVRGYENVKMRNVEAYREALAAEGIDLTI
ncbi:indolepyruvate ferredoxin oxidoreductase family protein [Nocardioides sp. NPDC004968]|uniref:indolepyruvate ferredoxin oxidoreductase family protein n=1 Tax=Nocardioides sp. NPDC004968 TaxID=3155894 RepID=UPI0033BFB1A2